MTTGTCVQCRHANHGTIDAADGYWACPWLGSTSPDSACRIRFKDTGLLVFEAFDGSNGSWASGATHRSIPAGYENRAVEPAGPRYTELDVNVLDRLQVVSFGMGWFFSIEGALAAIVSLLLIHTAAMDLIYAQRTEPVAVSTSAEMWKLKPNDYVKLTAKLDRAHAVGFQPLRGTSFTLTPVDGSQNRLFVHRKGPLTVDAQNADAPEESTLEGRIVAKDWFGNWKLNGSSIDVRDEFGRRGIAAPDSSLVLIDGAMPRVNAWLTFVGVASLGVLGLAITRIARTAGFLVDRRRLATHLNRAHGRAS